MFESTVELVIVLFLFIYSIITTLMIIKNRKK